MSRQLEQVREEKQRRRDNAILLALDGGLVESVSSAGGVLSGFSVSLRGGDCLITIKALLAGRPQIAFVGAEDLTSCVLKVVREAKSDRLRWRDDQYPGK